MSRLLVAEDKWRHIGIAPLGDRGAAEGRLVVAWTPSSLRPGGCDCSTAQTRGSGGPGRVQGVWGGEAGFPPPTGHSRGGAEVDRRVLWAGDRVDAGADTEHQFPVSPAPPPPPGRKEASPCLSQTF